MHYTVAVIVTSTPDNRHISTVGYVLEDKDGLELAKKLRLIALEFAESKGLSSRT